MIKTEEFIETIQGHELLKDFDSEQLERLAALAKEVHFTRDQVIFREGASHGRFYLIVDGSIVLEIVVAGRPVLLQTLHAGDAMGWSSLVELGGGTHFQARALSPVRALAFEGEHVRETCEADPRFGYLMMKSLLALITERLDATRMQLVDMYAKPGAAHS